MLWTKSYWHDISCHTIQMVVVHWRVFYWHVWRQAVLHVICQLWAHDLILPWRMLYYLPTRGLWSNAVLDIGDLCVSARYFFLSMTSPWQSSHLDVVLWSPLILILQCSLTEFQMQKLSRKAFLPQRQLIVKVVVDSMTCIHTADAIAAFLQFLGLRIIISTADTAFGFPPVAWQQMQRINLKAFCGFSQTRASYVELGGCYELRMHFDAIGFWLQVRPIVDYISVAYVCVPLLWGKCISEVLMLTIWAWGGYKLRLHFHAIGFWLLVHEKIRLLVDYISVAYVCIPLLWGKCISEVLMLASVVSGMEEQPVCGGWGTVQVSLLSWIILHVHAHVHACQGICGGSLCMRVTCVRLSWRWGKLFVPACKDLYCHLKAPVTLRDSLPLQWYPHRSKRSIKDFPTYVNKGLSLLSLESDFCW